MKLRNHLAHSCATTAGLTLSTDGSARTATGANTGEDDDSVSSLAASAEPGAKRADNRPVASIEVPSAPAVTVQKGDHQKADDAAVPTQLWDYFFEKRFLAKFGIGAAE